MSLNLGGRNTNPLEFILDGDNSDIGLAATAARVRAQEAMVDAEVGPMSMRPDERVAVDRILSEIFPAGVEGRGLIETLLRNRTWANVYDQVKRDRPGLFNSLNLTTLQLGRPAVLEAPEECADFETGEQYLNAWRAWYVELDRNGPFWREEAPKKAAKRSLDVASAFAGLLIYDVLCLTAARRILEGFDARDGCVPFRRLAAFARSLPFATFEGKHDAAVEYFRQHHGGVVMVQEARQLCDHVELIEDYHPIFTGADEFTGVLLRRDLQNPENLSTKVGEAMLADLERLFPKVPGDRMKELEKAWRTTVGRIAVVRCQLKLGEESQTLCAASLHCSKSEGTADLLESLKTTLETLCPDAHLYVVGLDSNVPGGEAAEFQARLRKLGFTFSDSPRGDQVTVAKQRTMFQTQVQKAGETDVSHKDYVLSWTARATPLQRGATTYTPDLTTSFGINRAGQTVRLPTTQWPFDHAGVATTFGIKRVRTCRAVLRSAAGSCCGVIGLALRWLLALIALLSVFSPIALHVALPCKEPEVDCLDCGWSMPSWDGDEITAMCEQSSSEFSSGICPDGWSEYEGSCYKPTPERLHRDEVAGVCGKMHPGADLVSITSKSEDDFVRSVCPPRNPPDWEATCWIGLENQHPEEDRQSSWSNADFQWITGENVSYTAWHPEGILLGDERAELTSSPGCPMCQYARIKSKPKRICGCQDLFNMPWQFALMCTATQLLVSAVLSLRTRPKTRSSPLIRKYFVASILNNLIIHVAHVQISCYQSEGGAKFMMFMFGGFGAMCGGSVCTILILQKLVLRRLESMGSARLARNAVRFEYTGIVVILIPVILPVVFGIWLPIHIFFPVGMMCSLVGMIVFAVTASRRFHKAWKEVAGEIEDGGSMDRSIDDLLPIANATKMQFFSVTLATGTAVAFFCFMSMAFLTMDNGPPPVWIWSTALVAVAIDAIFNDTCTHALSFAVQDETFGTAQSVAELRAARAAEELRQHDVARAVLKAGPTSPERAQELAQRETAVRAALGTAAVEEAFVALRSLTRAEAQRINHLYYCIRLRCMIMPTRFDFLVRVESTGGVNAPRQHVPQEFREAPREAAGPEYLHWLYDEAEKVRTPFFTRISAAVRKFNAVTWPSDLGLPEFPFRIWRDQHATKRAMLDGEDMVSVGEILETGKIVRLAPGHLGATDHEVSLGHSVVINVDAGSKEVEVQLSGKAEPVHVEMSEVKRCRGAGVFVPGPLKSWIRSEEKIQADYEGVEAWPPAASLLDLVRCTIVMDDPYSMAVFVRFLQKEFNVVRVKNRFAHDSVERVTVERLQAEFYSADVLNEDTESNASTDSGLTRYQRNYRDVMLNLAMNDGGIDFICEVQVTLSGISILKKSETTTYTVMRMSSPQELAATYVFSKTALMKTHSHPVFKRKESKDSEDGHRLSVSTAATSEVEVSTPPADSDVEMGRSATRDPVVVFEDV